MCTYVDVVADDDEIGERFDAVKLPDTPTLFDDKPRVARPSSILSVITLGDDGERWLEHMRWGFIPSWAKGDVGFQKYHKMAVVNARDDKVLGNTSMFRSSIRRRRCLIPINGMVEWRPLQPGEKNKQAFRFTIDGGALVAVAGIWDEWRSDDGQRIVRSTAMLTTIPNGIVAPIHDRMLAILPPELEAAWLDPDLSMSMLPQILVPFDGERMQYQAWNAKTHAPA